MKRKLLSVFLSLAMVLTMMPVFAMAEDTSVGGGTPGEEVSSTEGVAKIGDVTYPTLNAAVGAANAGEETTITMLKDTTETVVIGSGKIIVLDLDGHNITAPIDKNYDAIANNGKLTIRDSKKNGKIISEKNHGISVNSNSNTTIEYANIQGQEGAVCGYNTTNGAEVTIIDGVFTGKDNAVVIFNGSDRDGEANKVTINGGIFNGEIQSEGYIACGIYAPWKDKITVNGGTFDIKGGAGIVARAGNVTITGGEFKTTTNNTTVEKGIGKVGDSRVVVPCSALVFDSEAAYPALTADSNIVVTGGTFTSQVNTVSFIKKDTDNNNRIVISGGTFSSDVTEYCVENYVTEKNDGNTYTVKPLKDVAVAQIGEKYYKSLTDAYAGANDSQNTEIILLKDYTIDKFIEIKKPIILNLGGNVLTSRSSGFDVYKNFTIKNGTLNTATWGVWTQNENVAFTLESDATINADCDTELTNAAGVIAVQGAVVNIKGTVTAKHNFAVSGNGKAGWGNVKINIADKANISTTEDAPALYFPNTTSLNITGGTIIGGTGVYIKSGDVNISGGNITGNGPRVSYKFYGNGANSTGDALVVEKCKYPGGAPEITITGGMFKSVNANAIGSYVGNGETDPLKDFISGGSYSSKPTDYLKEKYIDKFNSSTKLYDVTEKKVDESKVYAEPTVGGTASPTTEELKELGIDERDAASVAEAAKKVEAGTTQLVKSADDISSAINDETAKIENYKNEAKADVPNPEKIEVRAYLKVEPKSYNKESNYTLDITPMYDVVVIGKKDNSDAEKVVESKKLTVSDETNITVQLPAGFVTNDAADLYVQHKGHEYNAAVAENNGTYTVSFINPDGFSEFTISKTTQAVAQIDDKKYTSLQAAVDAVTNGQTITVMKDTETASVSGNKSFTIVKGDGVSEVTLTAASGYNLTNDGNNKYTVSPRNSSSGSGSGSSTTTYTVTVDSVSNGTVTSSHKSAASGATVTLTVKPADGYAVEAVTAKDAKGNAVKVTEKDGKYTFAMPASNVTVSASFVKKGEQPAAKLFDDVAQGAYYYDAVKWAVDKGVTNGKTSNLFGSDDSCTRAQIVTFLWRAAGSPAASASVSFTDVKDSDYYAKAVAWAVEKGITNGTGDGKFSSDDTCTRAQCAAFLYRAAGSPEVTDAAAFSDVAADAYYAKAVAWAEKNGITNGLGNGKFGSDNSCTRAQIITFLYRTYQGK